MAAPLRDLILHDALVVVAPGASPEALESLGLPGDAEVRQLAAPTRRPRERDAVLLAVRDLAELRRVVAAIPNVGTARQVGVWFEREPTRLPTIAAAPHGPPLDEVSASRAPQAHLLLTFAAPAPVRPVLLQLARGAGLGPTLTPGWPVLGAPRDEPGLWPVADPTATIAFPARLFDDSVDFPPDLVLTPQRTEVPPDFAGSEHPVLGRSPQTRITAPELTREALTAMSDGGRDTQLAALGPTSLGAVDEKAFNPIGFDRSPVGVAVPLASEAGGLLTVPGGRGRHKVAIDEHGLSDSDLGALRTLPGLRLDWSGGLGPQDYCRVVVHLAMAGVPLVSDDVPSWARHLLAPELVDALGQPGDLTDALRREERSVRQRRAAFRAHSSRPWRHSLAKTHDLQCAPSPRVTVLLVTRRPDMLSFALRQVARQRGAELELVLGTHGFDADPADLAEFRDGGSRVVTSFRAEVDASFGDVLNQAAARAAGDVLLKMDDDDWYGPDFASDLLMARRYSGADIVGCQPEFTFIEPLWLTTRRAAPTEVFRPVVAGGTMLIDRSVFRDVGGFRSTRKYVDASLLSAVTQGGGSVYRTHGLGYVLRRGHQGHTWDPGLGYFVASARAAEQWRGFRPSALFEPVPADLPVRYGDQNRSS